jgi:hypothetical protein
MKLNPKKLAISSAIVWGLYVLLAGWVAAIGWGNHDLVKALAGLYIGYKATFIGGIIGGLWAVVDGLIGGYLVAVFYNYADK